MTLETFRTGKFSKLFLYEQFNLGNLLQEYFMIYLLTFLKSFVGIKRIIEKENPTKIQTADSLTSIIKFFDSKKIISIISS